MSELIVTKAGGGRYNLPAGMIVYADRMETRPHGEFAFDVHDSSGQYIGGSMQVGGDCATLVRPSKREIEPQ